MGGFIGRNRHARETGQARRGGGRWTPIERSDGTEFTVVASEGKETGSPYDGVLCDEANHCVAVGFVETGSQQHQARRSAGGDRPEPQADRHRLPGASGPGTRASAELKGVWCWRPTGCFAICNADFTSSVTTDPSPRARRRSSIACTGRHGRSGEWSVRLRSDDATRSLIPFTPTAIVGGYALFATLVRPGSVPEVCVFRLLTGRRCPLCGFTRATHSLARGQVARATAQHPLVLPIWVGALVWSVAMARRARSEASIRRTVRARTA